MTRFEMDALYEQGARLDAPPRSTEITMVRKTHSTKLA